jgi:diguanylate cyclase
VSVSLMTALIVVAAAFSHLVANRMAVRVVEEFCVLLPGATLRKAVEIAERLRARIERTTMALPDGTELRVTASIGVAACPDAGETARDVLAAADTALYRAKHDGRNRVCAAGR